MGHNKNYSKYVILTLGAFFLLFLIKPSQAFADCDGSSVCDNGGIRECIDSRDEVTGDPISWWTACSEPDDTPPAPAQLPSCNDTARYCDENVGKIIYKHGGWFDQNTQQCDYSWTEEGECDPKDLAPICAGRGGRTVGPASQICRYNKTVYYYSCNEGGLEYHPTNEPCNPTGPCSEHDGGTVTRSFCNKGKRVDHYTCSDNYGDDVQTDQPCGDSQPDNPKEPSGKITANPNPCTKFNDKGLCTSKISFSTENAPKAVVCVSDNGEKETVFASGTGDSQDATWIKPGHSYAFNLKTFEGASVNCNGQILSTVKVAGVNTSPLPPAKNLQAQCSVSEGENLVNPKFVNAEVSQTRGVGGTHNPTVGQKYSLSGTVSGDGFLDVGEWTKDNVWVRSFKPGDEISISSPTNWLQVGYNVKSGSVKFSNTKFVEIAPMVKISWDSITDSTAYLLRTNAFPDGKDDSWYPADLGTYTGTTHVAPNTADNKDFTANTRGNTSTAYKVKVVPGMKYNTSIQGVRQGEAYPYKGEYAGKDFSCGAVSEGSTCGGIAGTRCPKGYDCKLDGTGPDAGGTCVPLPTPTPTVSPEYTTKYQVAYDNRPTAEAEWGAEQDYTENIKVSHTFSSTPGDKFIFVKFKTNKGKEVVHQLKITLVNSTPATTPQPSATNPPATNPPATNPPFPSATPNPSSPLPPAKNLVATCFTRYGSNLVDPSMVSTTVSATRGAGGARPTSLTQKYSLSGTVSGDGFLDVGEWTKDNVWVRSFGPGDEIRISAPTNWLQVGYNVRSGGVAFSNVSFTELIPGINIRWDSIPGSAAYVIRTNAFPDGKDDGWHPVDLGVFTGKTTHIAPTGENKDFSATNQAADLKYYQAQVVAGVKYNTSIQGVKSGEAYPYKGQYAGVDFSCNP